MKRFLLATAFLLSGTISLGATLTPVQLLNPSGSTSGQAIVSTGASTAPAWGNVSAAALTGITPVVNGGTGSATAAGALTNLGAGATSSPLSQFAATTSAQLAGVLSDETGTGVAVFGTSPTLTTPNIVGITNASNASAGSVGQTVPALGTSTPLANATAANLASISLPPGDWYVWGSASFGATGGAVPSVFVLGINIVSATLPSLQQLTQISATYPANGFASLPCPMQRINISTTTTVYLVGQMNYASGATGAAIGSITAVRFSR